MKKSYFSLATIRSSNRKVIYSAKTQAIRPMTYNGDIQVSVTRSGRRYQQTLDNAKIKKAYSTALERHAKRV
ncbi:MAG: hypothetical protein AAGN35_23590 [Bacteroidota bacterium]